MSNSPEQPSGAKGGGATSKHPPAAKRKALHAYLSDDAHDTWHSVAAEHGVSVSALLEAMADGLTHADEATGFDQIVRRARQVDAERRRR